MSAKVDEWMVEMDEIMSNTGVLGNEDWMFFPVPKELRKVKDECYEHQHISLGLFRRDFAAVSPTDRTRIEFAMVFIEVYGETLGGWNSICSMIVEDPSKERRRYGHITEMSDIVVQRLLTLDAVFLVCYLTTLYFSDEKNERCAFKGICKQMCKKMCSLVDLLLRSVITSSPRLLKDVMLLENQIALELMLKVVEIMVTADIPSDVDPKIRVPESISPCSVSVPLNQYQVWLLYSIMRRLTKIEMTNLPGGSKLADDYLSHMKDRVIVPQLKKFASSTRSIIVTASQPKYLLHCMYEVITSSKESEPGPWEKLDVPLANSDNVPSSPLSESMAPEPFEISDNLPSPSLSLYSVPMAWEVDSDDASSSHFEYYVPMNWETAHNISSTSSSKYFLPTATELRHAGITIKPHSGGVSDVTFKREGLFSATLSLPVLRLSDDTERSLRNVAAYEQILFTHEDRSIDCDFQHYLVLMDRLINTSADVLLLMDRKVFVETLGDEVEIAEMWNRMGKGLLIDHGVLKWTKLFSDINSHYARSKPRLGLILELREKYFGKPWLVISFIAATFLLVLTFIQTFYSVRGGS